MTPLNTLLTHENPDLDATLCLWLLTRFGEARYPGISLLPVRFMPAGLTPDNLHPDELERTCGILAVDTGGGRLDTHARDGVSDPRKRDRCAASLVAEDLGLEREPALQKLLQFVTQQELRGRSIASPHPMDHLVSLPTLIRGLHLKYPDRPDRVVALVLELYDAAYATELDWFKAVEDFMHARVVVLENQARVVSIFSDTTAAVKVARHNRADLVIHRNSQGHTGITARHNGVFAQLELSEVAALLRTAEASREGGEIQHPQLRLIGMIHGWYLHDSLRILSRGSAKHRGLPASALSLEEIQDLTVAALDPARPVPGGWCARMRTPGTSCAACPLEPLRLKSCDHLRALQATEAHPTAGSS